MLLREWMIGGCAVLALLAFEAPAHSQPLAAPRTRNVVLIVSDGLRWQEIFTGADPLLLNEENGGIWDEESGMRRDYWRDSPEARRQALFPFLWDTVAARGQIFGNQTKGSIAQVSDGLASGTPAYERNTPRRMPLSPSTATSMAPIPT